MQLLDRGHHTYISTGFSGKCFYLSFTYKLYMYTTTLHIFYATHNIPCPGIPEACPIICWDCILSCAAALVRGHDLMASSARHTCTHTHTPFTWPTLNRFRNRFQTVLTWRVHMATIGIAVNYVTSFVLFID